MTLDSKTSPNTTNEQGSQHTPLYQRRNLNIKATYIISALILLATLLLSVWNYLFFDAWQILGDSAFVMISLVILLRSRALYLRGESDRAYSLLPIAIFVAFAPGELFLDGDTFYNLVTGCLLLVIGYLLFRPKSWIPWAASLIAFVVFEVIFFQYSFFPQFDVRVSPSWSASLPYTSVILGAIFLIQILTNIQLRTIQAKMLASIISLAILPAVIIGAVTGYLGFQETVDQIALNLDASANLKVEQIDSWLTKSTSDLNSLLLSTRFINNASLLPYFSQENYYHTEILADMATVIENTGNFRKIYLIGPEGNVLLSTDRSILDVDFSQSDLFTNGWEGEYITPASIDQNTNQLTIQIALPLTLSSGEVSSVLVGDLEVNNLLAITGDTSTLGETGETYLLNQESVILTPLRYSTELLPGQGRVTMETTGSFLPQTGAASRQYLNYDSQPVIGSHTWLPQIDAVLILEQRQSEAFESLNFALSIDGVISIITSLVAISFAVAFTRSISVPIKELSETASLVSSGELESMAPMLREDEIGELSQSLSQMTLQMLQTSQNLEQTVAERTAVLERRAAYLQTTAEIGRAITEIRNLDDLLNTVTHLISDRFGFYHVGIFIIDSKGEYAELKAANSEGGWRMLAREHKLRVGQQGIVGFVTGSGQPRIQQQVAGEDSVYYDNPDLPLTKSEMALPMISGGQILGCLDVQSTLEEAFSEEDVGVLQVLADEVAVAITNTNLFLQLEESLETERRVFGQITQEAWGSLLHQEQVQSGFKADTGGVQPITDTKLKESEQAIASGRTILGEPDESNQIHPLSVPIRVRGGHVVAVIETSKPFSAGPWTREEMEVLEGVSEQLGVALENARLFEETQRSAQRERISAELSGKIWASTDIETILQTAVRELGTALSASEGSISLTLQEESIGSDDSSDGASEA
jgi:GAF domain-containing protein/HAMP domain-containing protein